MTMQHLYRTAALAVGLASLVACEKPGSETVDRFVFGRVVEESTYQHPLTPTKVTIKNGEKAERTEEYSGNDTGETLALKIEAQEMYFDEVEKAQKMASQTYMLFVRDSPAMPLSLLKDMLYVGTEVAFRTRDDKGEPNYPVNRAGMIEGKDLRVINPGEDPDAVKGVLEAKVEGPIQAQRELAQARRYKEAQAHYNENRKAKE